jgi:uncharacterized lipoprotein YbaY
VRGSARASESSVVASEIDRDITAKPVPFELDLGGAVIDPSLTYTIQATIIDGENAWVTSDGIPVLTKGNPSNVEITLSHRPDLLKGAVTGQITGVGVAASPTAYAMAVLVDPRTGESLGIDVKTVTDGLPVAFAIGYTITDIDPTNDYVVTAEVGEGAATWRNAAGVPVITNGNPKSGIQVVVTEVVAPSPSPSPTPAATPTPAPTPDETTGSGLLPWIVLIAIVAAVAAFFIARGRGQTDELPPAPAPPGVSPDAPEATPEPAAGDGAAQATEPPAPTESDPVAPPPTPSDTPPPGEDPNAAPPR